VNFPHLFGSNLRGEGDQGFGPGKSLFKRLDKIEGGESKGFKETFHLNFFLPDAGEKLEEILRLMRIRIEADVEGLIPIRERFPNGLNHMLHPSKGHFFSARDSLQRHTPAAAPGALSRASSAHGKMIDGRLEGIHPEILLLGNSLYIERLTDITDIGEMIFQ